LIKPEAATVSINDVEQAVSTAAAEVQDAVSKALAKESV
jgi:hypothetical protein